MNDLARNERKYFDSMANAEAHGDDMHVARQRAAAFKAAAAVHMQAITELAESAAVDVPHNVYRECIDEQLELIADCIKEIAHDIVAGTDE